MDTTEGSDDVHAGLPSWSLPPLRSPSTTESPGRSRMESTSPYRKDSGSSRRTNSANMFRLSCAGSGSSTAKARSRLLNSDVPGSTSAPPPCPRSPWTLSRIACAPPSEWNMSRTSASRFAVQCRGFESGRSTKRVRPASPPSAWQPTHLLCNDADSSGSNSPVGGLAPGPEAVDRFVRWPVGLDSRLMATMEPSASRVSRHLPTPSPMEPSSPSTPPASRSAAEKATEEPAGTTAFAPPPGALPPSSTPAMETVAGVPESRLMIRRRLRCRQLLAGLNVAIRWAPFSTGTVSCMGVRKPSVIRTNDSASMSRSVLSSSLQFPAPAPVRPVRPFPGFPSSRSDELKWATALASMAKVTAGAAVPSSSVACMATSPALAEWLNTRTKPCRPWSDRSEAGRSSGTNPSAAAPTAEMPMTAANAAAAMRDDAREGVRLAGPRMDPKRGAVPLRSVTGADSWVGGSWPLPPCEAP